MIDIEELKKSLAVCADEMAGFDYEMPESSKEILDQVPELIALAEWAAEAKEWIDIWYDRGNIDLADEEFVELFLKAYPQFPKDGER